MVDVLPIIPFSGPLDGTVVLPGSKSITNRALLAAALAEGTSTLTNALIADDTEAMLGCISSLGATVVIGEDRTTITVIGIAGDLSNAQNRFFARQSGTTARFIAPVLALGAVPMELDADEAMRRRPMGAALDALEGLGVTVRRSAGTDSLPVSILGPVPDSGEMPVVVVDGSVSSQFTSGLLLAAACMPQGLRVELRGEIVSRPYLDMTVSVMEAFGGQIETPDDRTFIIHPGGYQRCVYGIEPDASAASYVFAAAAICGGSVRVNGLGAESLQGDVHFVDVLARMGAHVAVTADSITVTGETLHGVDADFTQISDTAQTIAAVAVFADGPTSITGIGFIRRKETDRIAAIVAELRRLGIDATDDDDGFTVVPGPIRSAIVQTYDDHRMAMSMALIGYAHPGVSIADPDCVRKTFPAYFDTMESLRPGGPL